MSKVCRRMEE